jgi:hypothetical protein
MSDKEKFELCLRLSEQIVQSYRSQACGDPQNIFATTTTLITMAILATAATVAGTLYSSQAQSDSAAYNAAVAKNNAGVAAQQADFDAQQIRDKNQRVIAQQRNAYAASGVALDSGSTADVQKDSSLQGEMQALMAIYTGKTSANAANAQARLFQMQSGQAQTAGYIGAGSSLLGGASNVSGIATNPRFQK